MKHGRFPIIGCSSFTCFAASNQLGGESVAGSRGHRPRHHSDATAAADVEAGRFCRTARRGRAKHFARRQLRRLCREESRHGERQTSRQPLAGEMGRLGESRAHFRKQRPIASALESGWKMDRVPFRPRRRKRSRSALDLVEQRRRSAKVHRPERQRRRLRLVARFKAHRARGARSRPARAGEERKREEDRSADRHRSFFLQARHRRLSDRSLFAFATARSRDSQDRHSHLGQTRRRSAGLVAGWKRDRVCDQARRRSRPHGELGRLRDRRATGREGTPGHHVARGRSASRLGKRAGLESGRQMDRLHSRRRSEEN